MTAQEVRNSSENAIRIVAKKLGIHTENIGTGDLIKIIVETNRPIAELMASCIINYNDWFKYTYQVDAGLIKPDELLHVKLFGEREKSIDLLTQALDNLILEE